MLKNASILVGNDGRISCVGGVEEVDKVAAAGTVAHTVDATGKSVLPGASCVWSGGCCTTHQQKNHRCAAGFVDAHTHAVFSGDRSHEMAKKLAGATYIDIYKAGGGIQYTVRAVCIVSRIPRPPLPVPHDHWFMTADLVLLFATCGLTVGGFRCAARAKAPKQNWSGSLCGGWIECCGAVQQQWR